MAALQFVDVPGYAAIIFRRTFTDLAMRGALMDRAREWLAGTEAKWVDREKTWRFPKGGSLSFGYLDSVHDKYRYQSSEFQFVAFDELTHFEEPDYEYLFSRLRKPANSPIPVRMRAASNPGGVGHDWVRQRFLIEGTSKGRVFIPAKLTDNPHLDQEGYIKNLNKLDPITRMQLLNGDWSVRQPGGLFKREWFPVVDTLPPRLECVRYWDLAATEATPQNTDPDWTVGLLLGRAPDGIFYVIDVRRERMTPRNINDLVLRTAQQDGRPVAIGMEEEGGSSGKYLTNYYYGMLAGFSFRATRPTGDKRTRANPVSSQAEAGRIRVLRAPWNGDFFDELDAFPEGSHDDQVDALSGAFRDLFAWYGKGAVMEAIEIPPVKSPTEVLKELAEKQSSGELRSTPRPTASRPPSTPSYGGLPGLRIAPGSRNLYSR